MLEVGCGAPVPAEREPGRPEILDGGQPQLLETRGLRLDGGRRTDHVGEGVTVPEVECGPEESLGLRRIGGDQGRCLGQQRGELPRVDVDAVEQ